MTSIKLKEQELASLLRKAQEKEQLYQQLVQLDQQYKRADAELIEAVSIAFSHRDIKPPEGSTFELKDGSLILNIPITKGVKKVVKKPVKKK